MDLPNEREVKHYMRKAEYYVRMYGDELLGTQIVYKEYATTSIRKIRKELKELRKDDWEINLTVLNNVGEMMFFYDKCHQIYIDIAFEKEASKILR